jgi:uncharacterized protein
MTSDCELGVMAKFWTPGRVKTRLAAAIGPRQAAQVYQAMLRQTVERFSSLADRRTIVFSPPGRQGDFANVAGTAWGLSPQGTGDLGTRMARYFRRAFRTGTTRVILIGADSPTLPVDYVERAFELLRERLVVLGPASDEGYYLVGAAGSIPPIFAGIQWSTPQVWRQTVSLLHQAQVTYHELPRWYDIDTLEDLNQAIRDGFKSPRVTSHSKNARQKRRPAR